MKLGTTRVSKPKKTGLAVIAVEHGRFVVYIDGYARWSYPDHEAALRIVTVLNTKVPKCPKV